MAFGITQYSLSVSLLFRLLAFLQYHMNVLLAQRTITKGIIKAKERQMNEYLLPGTSLLLSRRHKLNHVFFTHSLHSISLLVLKIGPRVPHTNWAQQATLLFSLGRIFKIYLLFIKHNYFLKKYYLKNLLFNMILNSPVSQKHYWPFNQINILRHKQQQKGKLGLVYFYISEWIYVQSNIIKNCKH